jgi:hypothetical protein
MAQKKTATRLQSRMAYGPRRASVLAAALLAMLLVVAGCGGASDRAGGTDKAGGAASAAPVDLCLVNTPGEEAQPFLDELARLSGATLRITGDEQFGRGQLTAEADALRLVQR